MRQLLLPFPSVWRQRFAEMDIRPIGEQNVVGIKRSGNALVVTCVNELTGARWTIDVHVVIADNGTIPVDDVYNDLRAGANNGGHTDMDALLAGESQPGLDEPGLSLFRIGDAVASRNAAAAMYDALRLCSKL